MSRVNLPVLGFIRNCCLVVVLALVFAACSDEDKPQDKMDAWNSDNSELRELGDEGEDVCTGKPVEGCPCTKEYEECCLWFGEGLVCAPDHRINPTQLVWEHFWDCPCLEDWGCTEPFPAMCWQLQGEQ
jgi:hypothetical protein